jgi:Fe-S cluster biogenesis protein NfuA
MSDSTPSFSEKEQLRGLIEQLNSYITTYHGGSVELVSYDGKVVKVKLGGACLGCPLSPMTVKGWVEGTVRQFFPNLDKVESIN